MRPLNATDEKDESLLSSAIAGQTGGGWKPVLPLPGLQPISNRLVVGRHPVNVGSKDSEQKRI
jgi:hypothetical protein